MSNNFPARNEIIGSYSKRKEEIVKKHTYNMSDQEKMRLFISMAIERRKRYPRNAWGAPAFPIIGGKTQFLN